MSGRAPPRSRWSWTVGHLFGISIRIHVTLLLLLVWLVTAFAIRGAGLTEAATGLVLVSLVFVIIVVHELAHALVARRFGCATRDILLLPIGGMSRLEKMPERPTHELLVALAGPAVNVALALVLALGIGLTGGSFDPADAATIGGALTSQLLWINVVLAAFNLLPAFPMDGGRVFRAVLSIWIGRERATRAAAGVGKLLAVGFVLIGLLVNPILAVIGVFVWFAAQQEASSLALRSVLAGVPVARAMVRKLAVAEASEPLAHTAARMLAGGWHELPVVDADRLVGVVTAHDLARALATPNPPSTVAEITQRDVPMVSPGAPLESVLEPLGRTGVALVVDGVTLVGMLTLDQVATYASFHAAPGQGVTVLGPARIATRRT